MWKPETAPQLPPEVPPSFYYLTKQWLDVVVNRAFYDNMAKTPPADISSELLEVGQSVSAVFKCTPEDPNCVSAEHMPVVKTPWFKLLFALVHDDGARLISNFEQYPDIPLTLWSGDPAPAPKEYKVAQATVWGQLLTEFMPRATIKDDCDYKTTVTAIWSAASKYFVEVNPQQKVEIFAKQSGWQKLEKTIFWETEFKAWIEHTTDVCVGLKDSIPEDQRGNIVDWNKAGGDITVYVEDTQTCKNRLGTSGAAPEKNTPNPCETYSNDPSPDYCTDPSNCESCKRIQERIKRELEGNEADNPKGVKEACLDRGSPMIQVQCKPDPGNNPNAANNPCPDGIGVVGQDPSNPPKGKHCSHAHLGACWDSKRNSFNGQMGYTSCLDKEWKMTDDYTCPSDAPDKCAFAADHFTK
jgi:hypothetical protein